MIPPLEASPGGRGEASPPAGHPEASPQGRRILEPRAQQIILLLLLAFAVLWRGGKSLDATWVLTGVAAFLTFMSSFQKQERDAVKRGLWITMMGFVGVTMLSYLFSETRNYGLDEALQTASLALIFFWTIRTNSAHSSLLHTQYFRVLTYLTVAACVVGVAVYILQPVDRFVGTFFDWRFHTDYWPNAFAEFLLLAWPMVGYLVFSSEQRGQGISPSLPTAHYCILGFVLGSLLLTYSRGAFIAFGGQLVLLFILTYGVRHPEPVEGLPSLPSLLSKLSIIACTALLTFFAVNAVRSQFFPIQSMQQKATFSAAEGGSSISERGQFFTQAVLLTTQKPLLGWGPYSFRFLQPRLQTGVLQTSDHPHNVFLKFAVERGIPAAILFAIIVGYILYACLQHQKFEVRSSKFEVLAAVAASGVLAHNLIDYNLQFVGIALPFWMLMGFLVPHAEDRDSPMKLRSRRLWEIILAGVLILAAAREGMYLLTSSLGRHAEARGEVETALRWYGRSRGEWLGRDLLLSEGRLLLFEKGDVIGSEQIFSRYLAVNDEDARAHRLFGDALRKQGNLRRAESEYRRAYDLGKWNDLSPVKALLSLYLQEGNTKAIDDWKRELLDLLRAYRVAVVENSHYIALGPNVEALLDIYQMLRGLYAEDDQTIAMWMEEVKREAAEERARLRSRSPGWLW